MALITAQNSCARILQIAKDYAAHLGCPLDVVTVQPLKAEAHQRSKDMICLTALAKEQQVNIRIVYSENPAKAVIAEVQKNRPVHVFIGQSGEKSVVNEHLFAPFETPVSVVGTDRIIYTLPAFLPARSLG